MWIFTRLKLYSSTCFCSKYVECSLFTCDIVTVRVGDTCMYSTTQGAYNLRCEHWLLGGAQSFCGAGFTRSRASVALFYVEKKSTETRNYKG